MVLRVVPDAQYEELTMADGSKVKVVGRVQFWLRCGNYKGKIIARVFPNLSKQLILGMPWLVQENPSIDWTAERVKIERNGTVLNLPIVGDHHVEEPVIEEINFCKSKELS